MKDETPAVVDDDGRLASGAQGEVDVSRGQVAPSGVGSAWMVPAQISPIAARTGVPLSGP